MGAKRSSYFPMKRKKQTPTQNLNHAIIAFIWMIIENATRSGCACRGCSANSLIMGRGLRSQGKRSSSSVHHCVGIYCSSLAPSTRLLLPLFSAISELLNKYNTRWGRHSWLWFNKSIIGVYSDPCWQAGRQATLNNCPSRDIYWRPATTSILPVRSRIQFKLV